MQFVYLQDALCHHSLFQFALLHTIYTMCQAYKLVRYWNEKDILTSGDADPFSVLFLLIIGENGLCLHAEVKVGFQVRHARLGYSFFGSDI